MWIGQNQLQLLMKSWPNDNEQWGVPTAHARMQKLMLLLCHPTSSLQGYFINNPSHLIAHLRADTPFSTEKVQSCTNAQVETFLTQQMLPSFVLDSQSCCLEPNLFWFPFNPSRSYVSLVLESCEPSRIPTSKMKLNRKWNGTLPICSLWWPPLTGWVLKPPPHPPAPKYLVIAFLPHSVN